MPKKPTLKARKIREGKWVVNVPPSLSKTGKRWRPEFPSEARANAEIRRILGHVNKHGVDSTRLTASQSVDARAALKILEGANPEGERKITLTEAADQYVKRLRKLRHTHTVAETLADSIKYRTERRGKEWSHGQTQEMKSVMYGPLPNSRAKEHQRKKEAGFLHLFGSRDVDSVTEEEITSFLEKHHGSSTTKDGRAMRLNRALRQIAPVFNYAHRRGWLQKNPVAFISYKDTNSETEVLSISTFNRAAELIQGDEYRDLVAGISILMWAGLRPSELMGNEDKPPLLWNQVILKPQGFHTKPYIDVKDVNAKGSEGRLVDMEANLVSWLETIPSSERVGAVFSRNEFGTKYRRFRNALGVNGKSDIFRHSFGTYHFHHFESLEKTMTQMGHSNRRTFEKHYKRYNPEEDSAFLYWQIVPEGAAVPEVVQFAAS